MIGYHQPDLSTNRTVYASCISLDNVKWTVKGKLKASRLFKWTERVICTRCCLTFRRLTVDQVFYENVQPMPSFFLKFCHSFD